MKRLVVLAFLLVPLLAFGQGRAPAYSVAVETDYFSNIDLGSESLYRTNLTSRYQYSLQHVLDYIDDNWQPDLVTTNWLFLDPAEDTAQSTFDWLDSNWVAELNTNDWTFLAPTGATVQAVFDEVDAALGLLATNQTALAEEVAAHTEQLAEITETLQGVVMRDQLCNLVATCAGTPPGSLVYYGESAYTAKEFTISPTATYSSVSFEAWGSGGNCPVGYGVHAGAGTFISGTMTVDTNAGAALADGVLPTGAVVRVRVGAPNFGYAGDQAGGGRATRVEAIVDNTTNLLFIAGGGGGASALSANGGAAGAPAGTAGSGKVFTRSWATPSWSYTVAATGGGGGTAVAGGSGGTGSNSGSHPVCTATGITRTGGEGSLYTSSTAATTKPVAAWYWTSLYVSGTLCADSYDTGAQYFAGNGGEGYYGGGDGGVAVMTSEGYKNGAVAAGGGGGGSSYNNPTLCSAFTMETTGSTTAFTNGAAQYVSGYGGERQAGLLVVVFNP